MESSQILTDDCWEIVINHLDVQANQLHLDQLSLVSKQLLSVTNKVLHILKVFDRTKLVLPLHLLRFPHVKMINLSDFAGDITSLLHDLANSDLKLQGLDLSNQKELPIEILKEIASKKRNFRVLKCSRLSILRDSEVITIGDAFPLLEELDISYPSYASAVTDHSIIALTTKVPKLEKLNLAGNASISDECLKSLSSNCEKLREVIMHHCSGVTEDGLAFLVKNNPNLDTLSLALPEGITGTINIPFSDLRFLHTLELFYMTISDHLLYQIADSKIPLKRFTLCHCKDFSFSGVIYFLHAYKSLDSISLADVDFLNDVYLSLFSRFFRNMSFIKLNCCSKLTDQAFSDLLGACPYLENLEMAKTGLAEHNSLNPFPVNHKLESLNLSGNLLWGEEKLKRIAQLCPNLMYLDLSDCMFLNKGIIVILENCGKIRGLKINRCQDITYVNGTSMFERLQTLDAVGSAMGNHALSMFARRSPELRSLNLQFCQYITAEGIKEVIKNCEKLLEINIMGCNIEPSFVRWMLKRRPRLRHIVPPYDLQNPPSQPNPFLRMMCPICSA